MSSSDQWLTSIASAGAAAATSCANSTSTRAPTVAFLIAGSARTFATPLMLASLQHLLVHPLSPVRQPALFLYLKTADSDKDGRAEHAESVSFAARTVGIQPLMNAVTTSWVGRHVVEAVIVNGSAAFSGRGWRPGDPLAFLVRQPEPLQLWRNYTAGQSCKWPFGTLAAKRPSSKRLPSSRPLLNNTGDAPGLRSDGRSQPSSLPSQEAHVGLAARMALGMPPDNNQEQRMLEQHLGLAWCGSAVERAEREQGRTFEVVAFIRPDLHLPYPLPPWCAYPYTTHIFACAVLGGDSLWLTPRRYLSRFTSQAAAHRQCSRSVDQPANHGHSWEHRLAQKAAEANKPLTSIMEPACCGPAEGVLYHTLYGGGRLPPLPYDPARSKSERSSSSNSSNSNSNSSSSSSSSSRSSSRSSRGTSSPSSRPRADRVGGACPFIIRLNPRVHYLRRATEGGV